MELSTEMNNKKNKNINGQQKEEKGKNTQWKKQGENCLFSDSPNGLNGSIVFNNQLNNYSNTFSMNYTNLMVNNIDLNFTFR
jgi:hypothetical protein